MLFRRKREDPVARSWTAFAGRLELTDASASSERMRRWLDLGDVELHPVYALQRDGQPTLYLFEYLRERSGPAGAVGQRVTNCLLRAGDSFASIGLRVHPKRNPVMESLEASRTGSSMVDLPPVCGSELSVFAREPATAARLFTAPLCQVLVRTFGQRGATSVVIGERHVLATVESEASGQERESAEAVQARHDLLEGLAADVFALYALLKK